MFYQFIPSKYCSMQLTHNFWKVSKMSNIHRTNIKVPGCIKNANLSRLTLGKYWKLRHNVLLLNSIIHKIFANTSLMPVGRFLQHLAKIQFLTMQIMTKPSAFLPTVKHMALKDKHHYSWRRMTEIQAIINTSVAVCSIIFYVLSLLTEGSQLQIYLKPLRFDPRHVAHLQLSVRKATRNHQPSSSPGGIKANGPRSSSTRLTHEKFLFNSDRYGSGYAQR